MHLLEGTKLVLRLDLRVDRMIVRSEHMMDGQKFELRVSRDSQVRCRCSVLRCGVG